MANLDVEIDSSGDCNDAGNIERPAMLRVTTQPESTQATTSGVDIASKLSELTPYGLVYNRLWAGDEEITFQ